ncbi:MAG: hypothetical protein SFV32_09625 [Opitutaceae bacterium]|nr:hypothetical protein [Opitutaceae bacterium]
MKNLKNQEASRALLIAALLSGAPLLVAQQTPTPTPVPASNPAATENEEEIIELSPFVIEADKDRGYQATQTLAGTRIRTDLKDVGSSISVITKEFMNDVGGYNNQTVLGYSLNTEVSGARGNFSAGNRGGEEGRVLEGSFANQNANTRVRGLTAADNTRNFFLSDIPWDGYNVSRVDLQRGPNAILFGLGSPAGVVNVATNTPTFRNNGNVQIMFDKWGTYRGSLDYNRVLIPKQLAVRFDVVSNNQKFQQKPAKLDDNRAFAAVRFAPAALNKDGNLLEINANYEHGEIQANWPRYIPPQDYVSSFFLPTKVGGLDKNTVNAFNDIWSNGNSANYDLYGGGTYNLFGPSVTMFANAGTNSGLIDWRSVGYMAYSPQGVLQLGTDGSGPVLTKNGGNSNLYRPAAVSEFVRSDRVMSNLAYKSLGFKAYAPEFLNDTRIFDFYNKLLDGRNKYENSRWDSASVDLQQSFFNNLFSYNLTAYQEKYHSDSLNLLGWWGNGVYMDINERMPDGTANPNLGRLYTMNAGGGNQDESDRERHAYRAQANVQYDFSKNRDSLLGKIIGSHSITGVLADEGYELTSVSRTPYDLSASWRAMRSPNSTRSGPGADGLNANVMYYLSGDIRASGLASANASNAASNWVDWNVSTKTVKYFDNTWIAGSGVNPKSPWVNPNDPTNTSNQVPTVDGVVGWTQASNPANYRGWTTGQVGYGTFLNREEAPGTGMSWRDYLTNYGRLEDYRVRSAVGVWQGSFWNRAIVGVFGWRSDSARSYLFETGWNKPGGVNPLTGSANIDQGTFNFENPKGTSTHLTVHTKNWSVMTHLNRFVPGRDVLPINVRLYYNEGENFKPEARIDQAGIALPAPGGTTKEKAIAFSTKDDRFSVRLTKFETDVKDATSAAAANAGLWAVRQIIGGESGSPGEAYPGAFARGILNGFYSDTDMANNGWGSKPDGSNSIDNLKDRARDWLLFEQEFKQKFPALVNSWFGATADAFGSNNPNSAVPRAQEPSGAVWTEDTHSEGYELEFTANPTPNWRMTLNGSKTTATRSNVGGTMFREASDMLDTAILTRPMGGMPIWWLGNGGWVFDGIRGAVSPFNVFHPGWIAQKAAEGQEVGELGRYRANFVTSYDFTQDRFKGFGVGGAVRWEDRAVIAYAPIYRKNAAGVYEDTINPDAPLYSPSQKTFDLWLSYSRKLSEKINWKIQLNIFNVGGKNKLVPIAGGVDIAKMIAMQEGGATIDENTKVPMKATNWRIKEGMSWQVTNTFEF